VQRDEQLGREHFGAQAAPGPRLARTARIDWRDAANGWDAIILRGKEVNSYALHHHKKRVPLDKEILSPQLLDLLLRLIRSNAACPCPAIAVTPLANHPRTTLRQRPFSGFFSIAPPPPN
jgi:hypothetical protein